MENISKEIHSFSEVKQYKKKNTKITTVEKSLGERDPRLHNLLKDDMTGFSYNEVLFAPHK